MSTQYIEKCVEEHKEKLKKEMERHDEMKKRKIKSLLNEIENFYKTDFERLFIGKIYKNTKDQKIYITIQLSSSIYKNIKGLYKNLDVLEFIAKFLIEKGFKIKDYGKDSFNDYVCIYDTRIMDKCERLINKHLEYIDKKINENTKYIKHSIYKNYLYKYKEIYKNNLSKKLLEKYKKSFVVNNNYVINPFYKQECNIL